MKVLWGIISALSVMLLLLANNAEAVNIVLNGSFETYTGTFGNVSLGDGGSQINTIDSTLTDWEIINDEIAILENGNSYNLTASDGTRFLDLAGYSNTGFPKGVSQQLNGLIVGQNYAFTMDLGIRNGACVGGASICGGPIEVSASIGTNVQTFTHQSSDQGNIWGAFGFNFIADSSTLTLEILGVSLPSGNSFIGLDNVAVEAIDSGTTGGGTTGGTTDGGTTGGTTGGGTTGGGTTGGTTDGGATVPEPTSVILFASGLAGLAYWRRKQKKA